MELLRKYSDRKELIKILENHVSHMLIMTKAGFEYYGLLKRAIELIKEGKMDKLSEIDALLEDLERWDLWD